MAQIIEASEALSLDRVLTVTTERGEEFVINADALARQFAEFLSDWQNEKRFGWALRGAWYKSEIEKLQSAALKSGAPDA